MKPKLCPNGTQMVPKWNPNRPRDVQIEVPNTRSQKRPLGPEKNGHFGAQGRFLSDLGAALGAILEKVDFEGGPQIVIFDAKSTEMGREGRSGGGSENSSKNERKKHAKMDVFWEAWTSKVMLPCRRREHFAKKGRRENGHQNGAKWEPKWLPKWS